MSLSAHKANIYDIFWWIGMLTWESNIPSEDIENSIYGGRVSFEEDRNIMSIEDVIRNALVSSGINQFYILRRCNIWEAFT